MQPMKFVVATMSLLVLVFVMGGTIVVVAGVLIPQGDHRRSKLNGSATLRGTGSNRTTPLAYAEGAAPVRNTGEKHASLKGERHR